MSSVSPQFKLTILLFLLIAMIFISFLLGRFHLSAADVISVFGGWMGFVPETRSASHVVMELRLPRIIGAVMVGGGTLRLRSSLSGDVPQPDGLPRDSRCLGGGSI